MNTLKAKQTIENFEVYSPAIWRLNYLYICQKLLFHFLKILIKMNLHIEFVYIIVKSLPHMQRGRRLQNHIRLDVWNES